MNIPVEVVESTKEGRCVLFAGRRCTLEAVIEADGHYLDQRKQARALGGRISLREAIEASIQKSGRDAAITKLRELMEHPEIAPGAYHRMAVKQFKLIFVSAWDDMMERAAVAEGVEHTVLYPGARIPLDTQTLVIYKLRGGFEKPETLLLTTEDEAGHPLSDLRADIRKLLRRKVAFFMGYRPDEEEFDNIFEDLSEAFGGELPRCHLAVAQGKISDYHWQKWVWRGLLLFMADPEEAMTELIKQATA